MERRGSNRQNKLARVSRTEKNPIPSKSVVKKQSSGVGMVKAPTRLQPGWECPTMPGIKSAYPGNCPGTKVPMGRKGEWTCRDHPQVSAAGPGQCPLDAVDLVKVQDLEKEKGKTISELTKEALAAKK